MPQGKVALRTLEDSQCDLWGCGSQEFSDPMLCTLAFLAPGPSSILILFIWGLGQLLLLFSAQFSSVQFSRVRLFTTLWTVAHQASLSFTIAQSLFQLMSIESVMPSNYLIFCCPLLLLPSIFSSIRIFSNESALHIRQPKYWSFSFSISSSNDYSGLISFRIDWFELLAVQGTLKSLLQHHSS